MEVIIGVESVLDYEPRKRSNVEDDVMLNISNID